ncbi:hypothetical protein JW926_03630 [Candidatus Sumerlaeota bacterium]|nr:hypothetical protein [Candidatus Sumerlaeota bacterium]
MKINHALDQISSIHDHLNRTEVYRGFRSLHVAFAGLIGCLAAALQPVFLGDVFPYLHFVYYWSLVACGNFLLVALFALYLYIFHESDLERRKTRYVWAQFSPCIVIGLLLTLSLAPLDYKTLSLLPGFWAFILSLGVFSTCPFLPRMSRWIALYYLLCGFVLLALAQKGLAFSPWGMGITFGFGLILGAVVLYIHLERKDYV